jgi:exosortase/archaeosortase family protein
VPNCSFELIFNAVKEIYAKNRDLIQFLVKLTALCGIYFYWFAPNVWHLPVISTYYGHFVHYTLLTLIETSVWILNLLGYGAEVVNLREIDMYDSIFNIHIRNVCLGIDLMFSFVALIISFPGRWLDRLWFIPLGLLGIQLLNVLRVIGLSVVSIGIDPYSFVDHHDVFNVVTTIFIFIMFTRWVKKWKGVA